MSLVKVRISQHSSIWLDLLIFSLELAAISIPFAINVAYVHANLLYLYVHIIVNYLSSGVEGLVFSIFHANRQERFSISIANVPIHYF